MNSFIGRLIDFFTVMVSVLLIVRDFIYEGSYLKAFYEFFSTTYAHAQYLRRLGLYGGYEGLESSGCLWKVDEETISMPGKIPSMEYVSLSTDMLFNREDIHKNKSNPLHVPLSGNALDMLWETVDKLGIKVGEHENTTSIGPQNQSKDLNLFIDLGCGSGMVCLSAMAALPFDGIFGVDINALSIDICERNLSKFAKSNIAKCQYTVATLQDMQNLVLHIPPRFPLPITSNQQQPSEQGKLRILAAMYEPLWSLEKHAASPIYLKTLTNLRQQAIKLYGEMSPSSSGILDLEDNVEIFIFYFADRLWLGDCLPALNSVGAVKLHEGEYSNIVFNEFGREFYVFKVPIKPPRAI